MSRAWRKLRDIDPKDKGFVEDIAEITQDEVDRAINSIPESFPRKLLATHMYIQWRVNAIMPKFFEAIQVASKAGDKDAVQTLAEFGIKFCETATAGGPESLAAARSTVDLLKSEVAPGIRDIIKRSKTSGKMINVAGDGMTREQAQSIAQKLGKPLVELDLDKEGINPLGSFSFGRNGGQA